VLVRLVDLLTLFLPKPRPCSGGVADRSSVLVSVADDIFGTDKVSRSSTADHHAAPGGLSQASR
jgi:hypothetical protein